MPGSTSRLSLALPLGTDTVAELRESITTNANALDSAYQYQMGALAALPAASTVPPGTAYYATDVAMMFHAVGGSGGSAATWINSMFSPGDLKCSAIASAPTGWLACNGQTVAASTYPALYAAIGTVYGGNSTNFGLPDMRGRVPIGAGTGTAARASAWDLGQMPTSGAGGEESTEDLITHSHGVTDPEHSHGVTDPTHVHPFNTTDIYDETVTVNLPGIYQDGEPSGIGWAWPNVASGDGSINSSPEVNLSSGYVHGISVYETRGAATGINVDDASTGISVDDTGTGGAANVVQPITVVNWFIKT